MNVRTIDGGKAAFNAVIYDVPNQTTLGWLDNNINHARTVLAGVGEHIVEASVELYNKVNNSAVINAAKATLSSLGSGVNEQAIYSLDYTNMGIANYAMQQYIMANPVVQGLHVDNMCNGFEETYYNPEPDTSGTDRYDYQRVMDGVVQEDDKFLYIEHFSNTDEVEISVQDQMLVLDTWDQVNAMILNEEDPTDPNHGSL